jgi:hypothetical protein
MMTPLQAQKLDNRMRECLTEWGKWCFTGLIDSHEKVVIGNIYENPGDGYAGSLA